MQQALTIFYTWAAAMRHAAAWQVWAVLGVLAALALAGCLFGFLLRRFFAALAGGVGFALCGLAIFGLIEKSFSGPALPLLRGGLALALGALGLALALWRPRPFIGVCGGAVAFFLALLFCSPLPGGAAVAVAAGAGVAGALASVFWTKYVFTVLMTAGGALVFPFLLDALFEEKLQKAPYLLLGMVVGLAAAGLLIQFLTGRKKTHPKQKPDVQQPEKLTRQEKLQAAAAMFEEAAKNSAEKKAPLRRKIKEAQPERGAVPLQPVRIEPKAVFFDTAQPFLQKPEEAPGLSAENEDEARQEGGRWTCLCGKENEAGEEFCALCATPCPPGWECPRCGQKNGRGKFFCETCGMAFHLRGSF